MPHVDIAVIGAGIIGLTTASAIIKELPDVDVTVFSDKFSPNTTSDLSNGLWFPFCFSKKDCSSKENVLKWGKKTYEKFMKTCSSAKAAEAGGQIISCFVLNKMEKQKDPVWHKIVSQYKTLDEDEAKLLGFTDVAKSGFQFLAPEFEMKKYLQFLMRKLEKKGVKFEKYKFDNLNEVNSISRQKFDYVINCAGLGARDLINDSNVFAVKDQIVEIDAPWFKNGVIFEDHDENGLHYILPLMDTVLLGAIHQKQKKHLYEDENVEFKHVINRTISIVPNLQNAKIIDRFPAYWSFRNGGVRLELEHFKAGKHGHDSVKVIHNYGHGGSGVSLSWGCGFEVAEILKKDFKKSHEEYGRREYRKSYYEDY